MNEISLDFPSEVSFSEYKSADRAYDHSVMSDRDLIDFAVWREMGEDITDDERKRAALEPSQSAIEERSKRAGLPVTKLTRLDDQLDQEEIA